MQELQTLVSEGFADVFEDLKPDLVVVLGDRYELLPIVSAALVMRIPVAHISGGDVTEGAIDDEVRNAVSMMSTLHFTGVIDSAKNLHLMLGSEKNVYAVGEPGLDSFLRYKLWDKEDNDLLKTYDGLKDSKENYITNMDIVKIIKQLPESLSITTPYIKKDNDSVPEIHQGLTEFIRKIQDFEEELTDQNAKLIKEEDSESLKNAQSKIEEFLKTEKPKK